MVWRQRGKKTRRGELSENRTIFILYNELLTSPWYVHNAVLLQKGVIAGVDFGQYHCERGHDTHSDEEKKGKLEGVGF